MKHQIRVIALLLICVLSIACSSDDLDYQNDFEKSQNNWLDFKTSSNDSYQYVVANGSVFTDYGWETSITVSNGVIIERHFKYTGNTENIPEDELEWTENATEINSVAHDNSYAAEALTLDDIYLKAEQYWLIKRKNATSYFEIENNGLISTCGYVEKGCMDDCFNGITIKSIVNL